MSLHNSMQGFAFLNANFRIAECNCISSWIQYSLQLMPFVTVKKKAGLSLYNKRTQPFFRYRNLYYNVNSPSNRMSSEAAPTITLKSPGSTTSFISIL